MFFLPIFFFFSIILTNGLYPIVEVSPENKSELIKNLTRDNLIG